MDKFNYIDAVQLMETLGAPPRLVRHGEIVSEVAIEIAEFCESLGIKCDIELVKTGGLLHDIGKVSHPEELTGSGSNHELAGEALLLEHGVPASIAVICRTHGQWEEATTIEQIIVAVADHVWRGVRHEGIEFLLGFAISTELNLEVWDAYLQIESCLSQIAENAEKRLADAQ